MFSRQRMQHFVLTPFYVRRYFSGSNEPRLASHEWLAERFKLFEDYCLPSVLDQSDRSFDWFIYIDESTPAPYVERLQSITSAHRNVAIKTCRLWDNRMIADHIMARLAAGTQWLLTTRLDNDDGLHRDFIATLHAEAQEHKEFLNFPRGIILYSGKCYLYKHPSNAFLSLVEPVEGFRTVSSIAHERASEVAPVRQLPKTPGFLQVVHGGNLSNKPRGTRMFARDALAGFETIPALRALIRPETPLSVLFDNATAVMVWRLRDLLISLAKAMRR
jgi:Putative rhamnosyl transferase